MNHRLEKLKKVLRKQKLDGLLVSSAINIGYLTNFFGFSKDEREAFLLITDNNQYLLTDGRYIEEARKVVKNFKIIEITSSSPFKKILKRLAKKHEIKWLGFEKNNLTVSEFESIVKTHPAGGRMDSRGVNVIENIRTIKNKEEISAIEKACALGDKTFDYILGKIKPGVREKDLATEIEFFIKRQGADISFPPIIAFGANSAVPHHQTSNQQLAASNQLILLDFGVKVDNYCSDMTRTVFFGKATPRQKRIYQTVLESQKKAIKHLGWWRGNDLDSSEVDRVARDYIIKKGYLTIPHSLGHGIGLEVHEAPSLSPKSKDKLVPGMVFSIEPGIYIENWGGVRIEDLVVLTKTGPRLLTKSPREIIEL